MSYSKPYLRALNQRIRSHFRSAWLNGAMLGGVSTSLLFHLRTGQDFSFDVCMLFFGAIFGFAVWRTAKIDYDALEASAEES
jgi:hypothetical protein